MSRRSQAPTRRQRRAALRASPPPAPAPSPPLDRTTLVLGAAIAVGAAAVYGLTAARDFVVGDTPELAAVALTLGVAHPPGYPLLILLGHAFSWLPFGPEAFRVNLLAVVCGASTVGLVYLTAYRLVGDRLPAALAALLLAFNPLFWAWSLVLEGFALNNLIAAATVYLLILWHEQPGRATLLIAAALVAGLGLSNHQTILLLAPAALYLLWRQRAVLLARPPVILACVGALAVGLLPYAYVPWAAARSPYWNWMGVSSVGDLFALITRQNYGAGQLAAQGIFQGGSAIERLGALIISFTTPELALAVLGWIAVYRERRWYAWFSALAFVFVGPLFVAYANINLATPGARFILERFFLLSHVLVAPLVAAGAVLVMRLLWQRLSASVARGVILGAAALVGGGIALAAYPAVDQSSNHIARRFGEDVLASLPQDGVLLVNGDETSFPVAYLQAVEGQRPDVTMVIMGLLTTDWYVRQLRLPTARLNVPFARLDGRTTTLAMLIQANSQRRFALVGPPVDDTVRQNFVVYGPGLVGEIHPGGTQIPLGQFVSDAERLHAEYRVPSLAEVKPATFERGILAQYAGGPYRVGNELERAGSRADAAAWYQRSLAIDPDFAPARDGLARVRT